ncbi:hypothetical protein LJB42_000356 [Komagataella kurtzmanii]|nr:hypothetical protein LJB42_000356 [Komagataella kurtzmanii]
MGCGASNMEMDERYYEQKRINDAIEKSLKSHQKVERSQLKMILLGAGESGKSTVLKQLRLLHKDGFQYQERLQYAQIIWVDAVQSMKLLMIHARRLHIPLKCDEPDSPFSQAKKLILRYRCLDVGTIGDESFLKDYVMKYSDGGESRRKRMGTGQADALWDRNLEQSERLLGDSAETELENQELEELKESRPTGDFAARKQQRQQLANAIQLLWAHDPGIQQCYNRAHEFQLEASTRYYFENIQKFADPDYICSDTDILKGRIKTTGITETDFNIGSTRLKVLDAGGQRSERRKWIHCFEDITAVVFVLAVSEFNQTLFEDERVNRVHEAILLFESLCNSRWFVDTPFILFLNKIDLLEEKLQQTNFKEYFPDYTGDVHNVDSVVTYLERTFLSVNRTSKPVYVHRTCATDTQSMEFVLNATTDILLQNHLKKSGLI